VAGKSSFSHFKRDGHFGLWVDQELYQGLSQPCDTFNGFRAKNEFLISGIELWGFSQ
jgi:hypothetical protein